MKKIDRNGFTLLEVMIFAAIFGIVVGAIYMMYATSHTTFTRGETKVELQQSARVALRMMANDIINAGYDPSDALTSLATTPIQTADANSVTFIVDMDGNNVTDKVRLRLVGTTLFRDSVSWAGGAFPAFPAGNTSELADGVRPTTHPDGAGLTFTYCDVNNVCSPPNAMPALGDIRRITIALATLENDGLREESFTLTTDVRLRNVPEASATTFTYQFDDGEGVTLTRVFTQQVAPGALEELDVTLASDISGASPPADCSPTCYAYDPNGGDAEDIPAEDLGYVGGLDSSDYEDGTTFENLVLQ